MRNPEKAKVDIKPLSDMKKDAVLDKYKFFVDSPNLGTDNDGTVRIVRR